ncbi:MAG: hypothetical protein GQ564_04395 [Bacteroidales bacterium]|nr:hypothetical protein [Bacteroidales bacterium]
MENEKSSVDILKDIAKRADWEFNIKEKIISARYGHTTRDVLIKNFDIKDSYFVSVQSNNFDKYRIYSGIFFPVSGYDNYKLLIRKRDQLDKFNFRKNKLRFKIGNSSFDAKVYIETNNDIETHKLLSSSKVQLKIIEYLYSGDCLYVGFNEINPNLNKDMEGKKFLSIFMALGWMLDKEMIDASYKLGELLKGKFNQNK